LFTRELFIPGVIDTGDENKVLNTVFPQILVEILKSPLWILRGLAETDSCKKPELENLVSDSL